MKAPDKVPEAVIQAIADRYVDWDEYGQCNMRDFEEVMRDLRWNFDHYYFERDLGGATPLYIGVELDGYMHT